MLSPADWLLRVHRLGTTRWQGTAMAVRKSVALSDAIHRLRGTGMTYDEIAQSVGCSPATVGRYLSPRTEQSYRAREEGVFSGEATYTGPDQLSIFDVPAAGQ